MEIFTPPLRPTGFVRPGIFLGGAITAAPDWQQCAAGLLAGSFAACFNPRIPREFTAPDEPGYLESYRAQVDWEHTYLLAADVVLFWMPVDAPAVTTRFELGWFYGRYRDSGIERPLLAVGIEPGVRGDTYYHIVLPAIGVPVHTTLEETCAYACTLLR